MGQHENSLWVRYKSLQHSQPLLLFLTFFSRPRCPGLAVHALKLVEIRPDLDLVHDSLLERGQDHGALRRDLHILGLPGPWRGQP